MYTTFATATTTSNAGLWYYLIMILFLSLSLYLFSVRPQKKRDKEMSNLRNNLQVGDEILTIGGFYGTVVRIKDDKVTIASGSEKTKLEISKAAINSILNREIPAPGKKDDSAAEEKAETPSPKNIKKLSKKEDKVDEIPKED